MVAVVLGLAAARQWALAAGGAIVLVAVVLFTSRRSRRPSDVAVPGTTPALSCPGPADVCPTASAHETSVYGPRRASRGGDRARHRLHLRDREGDRDDVRRRRGTRRRDRPRQRARRGDGRRDHGRRGPGHVPPCRPVGRSRVCATRLRHRRAVRWHHCAREQRGGVHGRPDRRPRRSDDHAELGSEPADQSHRADVAGTARRSRT